MKSGLGIIDEDSLNIFTDGSSYPDKKRAAGIGACFVWVNEDGAEVTSDYAPPGYQSATVDEMEIEACTAALKEANRIFPNLERFKRIQIFSDSRYVVENYFRAMKVWPQMGWRGSNGMPVKNINLWKRLKKEVGKCAVDVRVEWVKGHKKSEHNKTADRLAKTSAATPLNQPLSHGVTTKKWSKLKTKKGCVPIIGQEIKIRIVSSESIRRANTFEYRYEVIDRNDKSFAALDIVYCNEHLSRGHCYSVRFNDDKRKPFIVEMIEELESSKYRY